MDNLKNILRLRATKNAQVRVVQEESNGISYLAFIVVKQMYAIEKKWVKMVVNIGPFTEIPGTPPFLKGVVNVRGTIYSAINISNFLNQKDSGLSELNKLIIISNGDLEYGIAADEIIGFNESSISLKSSVPDNYSELYKEFVEGICKTGALILNGKALTESKLIIIK